MAEVVGNGVQVSHSNLGYGLVLLGLLAATFAAFVGLWSGLTRRETLLPWVRGAVYTFSGSMILSNLTMIHALFFDDFSVKYVAQVGSKATPPIFKVVSLWSALEGSILFWGMILAVYLLVFTLMYRKAQGRFVQLSLGIMAAVAVFFAFLIAGPANPWTAIPNPLSDGPGPNPLLQNHPLMIIHPPMLYLGYVGMTVPFGIASGALLSGEITAAWMMPLRKWSMVPFLFLSIGIILGSWWAYAVLGWGGYWAWDPVENAALLPWIAITAFLHSTMVLERKGSLKLWTLALGLAAFVLTIVGTFMTRSGVFNSVHSFTQSEIGPTFLKFIVIIFVFSFVLLVVRGGKLQSDSPLESVASREGSILLNNLAFAALLFTVLLGTIFPLVQEALFNKRISVGEPYFNAMSMPCWILILFLMGVGPMMPWGKAEPDLVLKQLLVPGAGALVGLAASMALGARNPWAIGVYTLAGFVAMVTLRELFLPAQSRMQESKENPFTALVRSASKARRRFGGYVVHLGIVGIAVAVAASSTAKVHVSGTVKVGETLEVAGHKVRFDGLSSGSEPHRTWTGADVTVIFPGGSEAVHHGLKAPRMNFYERQTDPVGSPMVDEGALRDVYVSLMAFDSKTPSATFNAWVFPLVGWIWYAIPVLVLGSIIALWPQGRRREEREAPAKAIPQGSA
ncbi:MAG: cytochrome c biogenesis protein CcsA [Myxococcaceae bacterium]|nr:cytochrome c biogenesis protein CcsA [Myxococcaceae bacterium]